MSSVSLPVAAMRVHWASWRAGDGRAVVGAECSCAVDDGVVVDSSAQAAMTRWMFVVMRVESWRSCWASARVWGGREVDIVDGLAGRVCQRCGERFVYEMAGK